MKKKRGGAGRGGSAPEDIMGSRTLAADEKAVGSG